jgi:hypothetical protein
LTWIIKPARRWAAAGTTFAASGHDVVEVERADAEDEWKVAGGNDCLDDHLVGSYHRLIESRPEN